MVVHIDLLLLISFTFPQFWLKSPWTLMGAEGLKDSSTFEWSSSLMFIYGFIGASILLVSPPCSGMRCVYLHGFMFSHKWDSLYIYNNYDKKDATSSAWHMNHIKIFSDFRIIE